MVNNKKIPVKGYATFHPLYHAGPIQRRHHGGLFLMFNAIYIGGTMGAFLCYFLHVFSKYNIDINDNFYSSTNDIIRQLK